MHVPTIIFILLSLYSNSYMVRILYFNCKSRNGSEKKKPNKVKRITAKAISHLYSCKYSSPITYLSVYAVNPCRSPVKLQNPN